MEYWSDGGKKIFILPILQHSNTPSLPVVLNWGLPKNNFLFRMGGLKLEAVLMRQAGLKVPGTYGPAKEEWQQYGMKEPKIIIKRNQNTP